MPAGTSMRQSPSPLAQQYKRPRLLIITPDFPPARGGIQTLVHGLALAIEGFEIEVVTLANADAPRFDGDGRIVTRRVGGRVPAGRARVLALNAVGLRRALQFRPNVVLSAHVVTSPAAAVIRRLLGGRTVQYFYANEILGKPKLAAFAVAHADVPIAISAHTASLIAATGASTTHLRLIPPGIDLPSNTGALHTERPTVLTVAQLKHSYKGHDVLIGALARVRARVPDVEWVIIGEGPLRSRLEQLVRSTGVAQSVRFLGEVSERERNLWLRRADVFAMPSRQDGEGFGIAYLEASAYGKPVLAGNVAGALDAVADGISGVLVDPDDPAAVGEALASLLLDREWAGRLGRAGAERARKFAWPIIAERVEAAVLEPAEMAA
jgi:phosphatidylinositol alpha-1,6-mannosyltransferase